MPKEDPVKKLAAEIKADEQAARIRDHGEADAATYDQRVREGASSLAPGWHEELSSMFRDIANPPDFSKARATREKPETERDPHLEGVRTTGGKDKDRGIER